MATATRAPMTPMRKTALIAGVAYIATFVFSIPVKFGFWADVLDNPEFVLGTGNDSTVLWGALFEVLTAFAGVATAVALYSVARRHSDRAALGYVTTRVLEAAMIFVGVLSILAIYTLRQDVAGTASADSGALVTARHALVAIHDWTFLIGPGVMAAANALLIGSVMYRSRLLPRWIPTLGLIGAPLLLASCTATLFGAWDQVSGPALLLVLPIAVWEMSFGIYMTVKGFQPSTVGVAPVDDPRLTTTRLTTTRLTTSWSCTPPSPDRRHLARRPPSPAAPPAAPTDRSNPTHESYARREPWPPPPSIQQPSNSTPRPGSPAGGPSCSGCSPSPTSS